MDALRRFRTRTASTGRKPLRVQADDESVRQLSLRGADRRLAAALDQLRSGVPLNWGQVEDDPEMAMLARLQQAGEECRLMPLRTPSSEKREELIQQLSTQLPKPVVKPQKAQPKSLAGFSESVPVLTQAEDNIKLSVGWRVALLRGAIALVVLALAAWGLGGLLKQQFTPTYAWIEALQGNQPVSRMQHVLAPDAPQCALDRLNYPLRPSYFVPVQTLNDAQADVGYNIPLLPASITVPTTYTFLLAFTNVDPCDGSTLKPSDAGAAVDLQYRVGRRLAGPTATPRPSSQNTRTNIPGQSTGNPNALFLSMFVLTGQPTFIDVSTGSWHEVHDGDLHGLYWHGGPYRDPSGAQWAGDISVLMVEHLNTVVTIVGSDSDGLSEDVLTEAARNIQW